MAKDGGAKARPETPEAGASGKDALTALLRELSEASLEGELSDVAFEATRLATRALPEAKPLMDPRRRAMRPKLARSLAEVARKLEELDTGEHLFDISAHREAMRVSSRLIPAVTEGSCRELWTAAAIAPNVWGAADPSALLRMCAMCLECSSPWEELPWLSERTRELRRRTDEASAR